MKIDNTVKLIGVGILFVLAVAWICLVAVPQFVDRISRHEATWTDGGFRHTTEMASEKVSEED